MDYTWQKSWCIKGSLPEGVYRLLQANLERKRGYLSRYDAHVLIQERGLLKHLGFADYTVITLTAKKDGAPPAIMADYLLEEIPRQLGERVLCRASSLDACFP